ncbi:MAG: hypothetical protein WDN46_24100 [Methylocella sp.]
MATSFTVLQVIVAIVFSGVGAWLAWQQVQIARVKLQHELYDKRYRVYDAARALTADIVVHANASDEAVRQFVIGTSDAVFLFDDDKITQYLEEMRKRAAALQSVQKAFDILAVGSDQKVANADRFAELTSWFDEQLSKGLRDRFKPFLQFNKLRWWW